MPVQNRLEGIWAQVISILTTVPTIPEIHSSDIKEKMRNVTQNADWLSATTD